MAAHHFLSASSSKYWLLCPARPIMSMGCAEQEAGAAAALGTNLHLFAEQTLRGETITAKPPIPGSVNDITLRKYIAHVENARKSGCTVKIEFKSALSPMVGGTADAVIVDEMMGIVDVIDLKTGKGEIDATTPQLGIYLLAERKTYGRDFQYRGHIYQEAEGKMAEWSNETLDQLEKDIAESEASVEAVLFGDTKVMEIQCASDKACQYCPGRGRCGAYAASMFPPRGEETLAVGLIRHSHIPDKKLCDKARVQMILAKPGIEKYLKAVEEQALAEVKAGRAIPGLVIGSKKAGNLEWLDEDDAAQALLQAGLLMEQVYTKKVITPTQAKKLAPEEVVDAHSERAKAKESLVPEGAASKSADIVFE